MCTTLDIILKSNMTSKTTYASGITLDEEVLRKLEEERLRRDLEEKETIQREWENSQTKKQEDAEHQLRLDREAASAILAEEARNEREWRVQMKKEQDEEYEFYCEFGCFPYQFFGSDSDYDTD